MKRLLFILVLLPCFSFGQSLVGPNKLWTELECSYGGGCWPNSYKIEGDTIIDTLQYQKVWSCWDTLLVNWSYRGAIREDTSKKIYYNYNDQDVDLLYDFNLTAGDTFTFTHSGDPHQIVLDSIDTVMLNGEPHKRMIFEWGEEWIEGIGSSTGLLNVGYYNYIADVGYELLCFTENDTLKYNNPSYNNCFYYSLGINEANLKGQTTIYPNPSSGIFTIEGATAEIQIFDLFGRLLLSSNKPEIDMSSYPAGLYIWQVGAARGKLVLE